MFQLYMKILYDPCKMYSRCMRKPLSHVENTISHFSAHGPYGLSVLHYHGSQPENHKRISSLPLLSSTILLSLHFSGNVEVELLVRNFFRPVDPHSFSVHMRQCN